MSRCFPYPPPGYALSSARKDALIESIKFQMEKVKAEEHKKKEKKKEKKEKRKDKSEKKEKKDKKSKKDGISDVVHGSYEGKKSHTDAKADLSHKGSKAECEQLERSSLTEEHAKPVSLRVPSSSSDSTENSNKRKRQPSPVDVSRGHGKIIRIRLSSKKLNQCDAVVNEQKHCSTSGRIHAPPQTEKNIAQRLIHAPPQTEQDITPRLRNEGFCSTSGSIGNVGQSLVLKTGGERFHIASKPIETAPPRPLETKALPAVLTTLQKEALIYRDLIENWVPPPMHYGGVETGDDDWLFGGKNKVEWSDQSRICRDDSMSCSNTLSLWPRAQYLPEVDIYALPYTIPF